MDIAPQPFYFLSKDDETYGSYSSYYSQIIPKSLDNFIVKTINTPSPTVFNRLVGKVFSLLTGKKNQVSTIAYAQLSYLLQSTLDSKSICHILNIEDHLLLLELLTHMRPNILATIHFPPSLWSNADLYSLRSIHSLITLCRRDQVFFDNSIISNNTFFIRHGVNTKFFRPSPSAKSLSPRVLFVGKWLRDFETAGNVLLEALGRWDQLVVDIVCPLKWYAASSLGRLVGHPRVYHHEGIDDLGLLQLYQQAWVLLLPLIETSANNALCEALACGVVPIVNNVGGVPDYGGITHFPLVNGKNIHDYLDLLEFYFTHPQDLLHYSSSVCNFAQHKLNWELIKGQHLNLYNSLFSDLVN